jgi:aminoglycoside phosphotransferase (APT) family kinase protein
MRRKPPGKLLPSAHAVDREYRVMTALAKTDVPVAKELRAVRGRIGHRHRLLRHGLRRGPHPVGPRRCRALQPAERGAIFDEMNRVIAALHRVDYAAVGLADYGKPGSYFSNARSTAGASSTAPPRRKRSRPWTT